MPESARKKQRSSSSSYCYGPFISKWRLAAAEQFSDWTVEVVTKQQAPANKNDSADGSVENEPPLRRIYHLHKVYLGMESEYFRSLILSSYDFKESAQAKTSLELQESAANAFPEFLDFIYGCHDRSSFSPQSAVALKHLAEYLQVDSLRASVVNFIQDIMDVDNVDIFYNGAIAYSDNDVLDFCLQAIARLPRTELLLGVDTTTNTTDGDSDENEDARAARKVMSALPAAQKMKVLKWALGHAEEENQSLRLKIREDENKLKTRKRRIALLPPAIF